MNFPKKTRTQTHSLSFSPPPLPLSPVADQVGERWAEGKEAVAVAFLAGWCLVLLYQKQVAFYKIYIQLSYLVPLKIGIANFYR